MKHPEKIYIRNYITIGCTKNITANTSPKRDYDIEYIRADLVQNGELSTVSDCIHPYEFVERDIITEITHCTKCNQDII